MGFGDRDVGGRVSGSGNFFLCNFFFPVTRVGGPRLGFLCFR